MLSSTMKSVGEMMAIGRTFREALGKAWRGIEKPCARSSRGRSGAEAGTLAALARAPARAGCTSWRRRSPPGRPPDEVAAASRIDPWFVDQIAQVVAEARALAGRPLSTLIRGRGPVGEDARGSPTPPSRLVTGATEAAVRRHREALGVQPVYKTVDTCGGEFPATTPYHFSTYEQETEVRPGDRPRVVILGAGPNRIGQGIEFDYACVHAAYALEEAGYESVMVNSQPRDRLHGLRHLEPPVLRAALARGRAGRLPRGATGRRHRAARWADAARLARILQEEGFAILGTSPDAIDLAEDRGKFARILAELEISAPEHGEARTLEEARAIAAQDRVPGRRPSLLRARRSRDGDRLRRRGARAVRPHRRRGLARPPRARRPVPGGGDRGGRRRRDRRDGDVFVGR